MTTGSSPVETVDTPDANGAVGVDASTVAADANPTASSPADDTKDAKGPTSMLEAVQAALKQKPDGQSSSPDENGERSDAKADPAAGEQPAEGAAEGADEDVPQPFHKHPAWQRLKGQRDQFKASHETLQGLNEFMTEAQLGLDEVNQGFEIMRLMKRDPEKALAALRPFFTGLMAAAGKILPDDLKQKVEAGAIADDLATELAQRRQREVQSAEASRRASEDAGRRLQSEIAGALTEWERGWSASDADYSKKQKLVQERIENRLLRGERPATAAAATKMANECRAEVDKHLGQFVPKKTTPISPVAGAAASSAVPEPKTMLDVVRMGGRSG